MTPGRLLNDDMERLEPLGDIRKYTVTFPYTPVRVELNGEELTEVSSISGPGEYSYDASTQTMNLFLDTSASVDPTTPGDSQVQAVVAYHHLFFSSKDNVVAPETPTDSSTALREWEYRIENSTTISQSL